MIVCQDACVMQVTAIQLWFNIVQMQMLLHCVHLMNKAVCWSVKSFDDSVFIETKAAQRQH